MSACAYCLQETGTGMQCLSPLCPGARRCRCGSDQHHWCNEPKSAAFAEKENAALLDLLREARDELADAGHKGDLMYRLDVALGDR